MATCQLHHLLSEQYVPRLDEAPAIALATRLEHASAQLRDRGTPIRWAHGVAIPEEENLMCFIDAETIGQVLQASRRAGTGAVHLQKVIALYP